MTFEPRIAISRRHFLQGAGTLAAGAALGAWSLEEVLAAPPAMPRNTAFLNWIAAQTRKPARFDFCVMGDNRPNTQIFDKVVARANSVNPAFTIHLGDLVEGGTSEQWNRVSASLSAFEGPIIGTLGNHDRHLAGPQGRDLELWAAEWGPREWEFFVGGWHFVSIDTSMGRVTKAQQEWLDQVLADDMPTMVFTHYPPAKDRWKVHALSSGTDEFLALLAKHTVEFLFCGHNHLFDQMQLGPTAAVITGGAGSHLYRQWGFGTLEHHVTRVSVVGPAVEVEMLPI